MANTTAIASGVNKCFATPLSSKHGNKNDADGKRRNKRRDRNLLRAVQNRPRQRLPHAQIAVNILDFDRCIIHQNADRQRKSAERHDIRRLAQQPKT